MNFDEFINNPRTHAVAGAAAAGLSMVFPQYAALLQVLSGAFVGAAVQTPSSVNQAIVREHKARSK